MLIDWDDKTIGRFSEATHERVTKEKFVHTLAGDDYKWKGTTKRRGRGRRVQYTSVELRATRGGTPVVITLFVRKDKMEMRMSMGGKLQGDTDILQDMQAAVKEGERVLLEMLATDE